MIVTTGAVFPAVGCHVTVLSVLVEPALPLPAVSVTLFAAIEAMIVPPLLIPFTRTSHVVPSFGASWPTFVDVPALAVPLIVTDVLVSTTGSVNTAVKWIGAVLVGSLCVAPWLIVTVGLVRSSV